MTTGGPGSRRWWGLALVAAAQFMVIMDTSIIGVALPKMQADLGFTPEGLSWVFNAYVVAFGGLLLLGGRLVRPVRRPPAVRHRLGWSCSPGPWSPVRPATSGSSSAGRALQGAARRSSRPPR